jgi:hypothetical protein
MRSIQALIVVMAGGLLGAGLSGCEKKGPAEQAGENIDDAAKDLKQGAEKAADKVEDTAKEISDKAKDGK